MRVVIAEDSALFREGLARILADGGFDVVAQARDADELMRAIGGRRSADQIKALDWDGDPDVWIAALALSGRHRPEPFEE